LSALSKRKLTFIFLAIGIGAAALLVIKLGPQTILDNLILFAPAFPIILAIEAASNLLSIVGWYYSFNPNDRPPLPRLQLINFASLPLSGALPSGQAGEVLKGNLLRGRAAGPEIVSSLVVYNYLHIGTTALVMAAGPVLALICAEFQPTVALALLGISLAMVAVMAGLGVFLRLGVFQRVTGWMSRLPLKSLKSDHLQDWAKDVDGRFRQVWNERRGDLLRASAFLILGRLVQIGEVYVILYHLGLEPTVSVAAIAFSGTALANYLLLALPAREGFLEGSAYVVFELLGLSGVAGLSMEIARRLRKIAYQIFGLVLLFFMARD